MRNKILKIMFAAALAFLGMAQTTLALDWGVQADLGGGNSVYVGEGQTPMNSGFGGINNNFGLPSGSILGIIQNLLFWLLAIFSLLAIIAFVVSGLMYLSTSADADLAKKAKEVAKNAVIGIIIGLSGIIIITAVNAFLAGSKTF